MIALPIGDENPCRIRPVAHWTIWGFCLAGGIVSISGGWASGWAGLPIALNLLFLSMLGDNVEDRLGSQGYVLFAVVAAAVGTIVASLAGGGLATAYVAIHAVSAAAIGAYAVWFPRNEIRLAYVRLAPTRIARDSDLDFGTTAWSAWVVLGLWAAGNAIVAIFAQTPTSVASLATFGAAAGLAWAMGPPPAAVRLAPATDASPPPASVVRRDGVEAPAPVGDSAAWLEVTSHKGETRRIAVPGRKAASADGRWGVIRTDELPFDLMQVGHRVSSVTGELKAEAAMRLRRTRGAVARGVERGVADALVARLAEMGLAARVVPDGEEDRLPDPIEVTEGTVDAWGFRVKLANGYAVEAPWPQIFLVAGMATTGVREERDDQYANEVLDIFHAHPYLRMRAITAHAVLTPSGLRAFCKEILDRRRGTPINPGVSVIANRGRFGYLRFEREIDRENYLWWLVQLVRHPAAEAKSCGHFLE